MKTKILNLFLLLVASMGTMFAEKVQIGDLYYNLNSTNHTAEITYKSSSVSSYNGNTNYNVGWNIATANIPAYVTYNSVTYTVTSIGFSAFQDCMELVSVVIPNTVKSIGSDAFKGCNSLNSITIPNSVTSIGAYAFRYCRSLTSIALPDSVTDIKFYTFHACTSLTSVRLGDNIKAIRESAFYGCCSLISIVIPNNVSIIEKMAFYNCNDLSSATIGSSVRSIGEQAFDYCPQLTLVTINSNEILSKTYTSSSNIKNIFGTQVKNYVVGDSVASIGDWAFSGYSSLNSVIIGNNVTSIGNSTFSGCGGLTSVTIPNSVTIIGDGAFRGCSGLATIELPNSVTSVGENAFKGCAGLNSPVHNAHLFAFMPTTYSGAYNIPDGVESITGGAFDGCSGLTSVTIPNSVTSIGNNAFGFCSINKIYFIGTLAEWCNKSWSPANVSSSYDLYIQNVKITNLAIPGSVAGIGKSAFQNCRSLTSITIEAETPPTLGSDAFSNTNNSPIYVPCGTIDSYKTAWTDYASRIQYVPLPYTIAIQAENGNVTTTDVTTLTVCDPSVICTATANYGYHFAQWSDGNTDNPRTIVLASDTTFTAEFAKNTYTISTTSANPEWGTTAGDTMALYMDEVEISVIPNYGYHFVRWNDNNTSNPRIVSVTEDKTFTATFAKNIYSITKNAEHGTISGNSSAKYLDEVTLSVSSDYGYHFAQWSDGNTDNPRTIVLTKDTTFTAEFAKNTYTISTTSANLELGTTSGDTTALYLEEVEISAIPNYGYRFVRWNDGNTSNPRTVTVTTNETYTATFAKNVYSITKNAEHGSISGNSSAEYLDFVTLTVTPNYGYHFVQWSDGLKDNPRIAQITQDTTFTAEFAYDRVGTCGKDLALVWSYDPTNKVLTIGNAGSFTENMQFGAEAPNEMEELVIGNSVTAIGANAFAGISSLKKVSIGESVKTIGEQAFYNCVNLEIIFNYRPTPTNTYSNAFDGVDKFECVLYVLPSSIDMYKNASVWRDFYYTYAIGAEETTVTTNDVTVEPQSNAATVTWPTSENAASYTIQITKDGVVFCTLIFNGNGQLTGIAFAPSRDGQVHAPAAIMTANGLQFTVTGLNSNTQYGYNLTAKDANDQTVATYSGEFTTTGEGTATGLEDVQGNNVQCTKIVHNGQIFILRGEKIYTLQGQEVK